MRREGPRGLLPFFRDLRGSSVILWLGVRIPLAVGMALAAVWGISGRLDPARSQTEPGSEPIAVPRIEPPVTDPIDELELASARDIAGHAVRWVRGEPVSALATFGRLQLPIRGVALEPGGVLYATLKTEPGRSVVFGLRSALPPERHGRAYELSVEVDSLEIGSSIDVDPGAGDSRTLFFEHVAVKGSATLRIRAGWRNTFPVVIENLASYRLPESAALGGGAYQMGLGLLTSKGHGFSMPREEMEAIRAAIPPSPYWTPQAAALLNFAREQPGDTAAAVRALVGVADAARFPLRILPQLHWAGIPAGVPDGAGGLFTDVPYQQITWDPADSLDDPGLKPLLGERYDVRFGLTVPNIWGNTPWLTLNHPRLNQFWRLRLIQAIRVWNGERERLSRSGRSYLLPGQLSTGEETVYWAKGVDDTGYTAANGGKPRTALLADFNPFTVADALADRIVLDPKDGLDRNERWWLHQNLARRQQAIVDWILEAMPPEPIRVADGFANYAQDLVRRNVFTEPYAMPVFPMRGVNPLRPGLEVGYVREGRSGGEYWSGSTMLPLLIKERERGRIALPNLECTGADDGQLMACVLAAYAHGAVYTTLYNWQHRPHIRSILEKIAAAIAAPVPIAASHVPPPRESTPASGPGEAVVAPWEYRLSAGADAFGVNTVVLGGLPSGQVGMVVRAAIRTLDEKPERRASCAVRLQEPPSGPVLAHLPAMFHLRPGANYAVTVEIAGMTDIPQPALTEAPKVSLAADVRWERWRSRAVSVRVDADDILQAVERLDREPYANAPFAASLARSRRLATARRYSEAYREAVKAEQLAFPSAFVMMEPGGRLGPFPIDVRCPQDRVRATVQSMRPDLVEVQLVSAVSQTVTIRYGGRQTSVALTADAPVTVSVEAPSMP